MLSNKASHCAAISLANHVTSINNKKLFTSIRRLYQIIIMALREYTLKLKQQKRYSSHSSDWSTTNLQEPCPTVYEFYFQGYKTEIDFPHRKQR